MSAGVTRSPTGRLPIGHHVNRHHHSSQFGCKRGTLPISALSSRMVGTNKTVLRRQRVAVSMRQAVRPVMDIARDPRWARVQETYGQDPYLCSAMAMAARRLGVAGDLRRLTDLQSLR
jgi:hypothetical protein